LDTGALPTGYQSVSGNIQFNQSGNTLDVTTAANQSIANYNTFNVGSNATVNFNLPDSNSVILNHVTGGSASEIMGRINSNG
jgi:large exoprotein involved in heme utilization and adhesion